MKDTDSGPDGRAPEQAPLNLRLAGGLLVLAGAALVFNLLLNAVAMIEAYPRLQLPVLILLEGMGGLMILAGVALFGARRYGLWLLVSAPMLALIHFGVGLPAIYIAGPIVVLVVALALVLPHRSRLR